MKEAKEWLIWSIEHDAWWAPDHKGYVERISNAGRYAYTEAMKIVHGANWEMRRNQDKVKPYEAMVHVSVLGI